MAWKIESERQEEEIEFVPVTLSHCTHVRSHICEVCVPVCLCVRVGVCARLACVRACVRACVHVPYTYAIRTHIHLCGGSIKCVLTLPNKYNQQVQVLLNSTYQLKAAGGHESFVQVRNLISE